MSKTAVIIVSHSEKIAEGINDLVSQTKQPDVHVFAAGGTEDGEIGTSADKIQHALQQADNEAGTLVFYDIGSALMNAELALDMLPDLEGNVEIVNAPVVEGTYVAVVEAGMGKSLEDIAASVRRQQFVE
ncbi:dihydroxyacetone kinase phosphoryl donor subunit DhaM [Salibacterium halotolerans]|uniref:phosphoenolpyruvate--glycerone phosphotransferase n=1 Tax=Salibacterium halotolerans TaxID=1884432 RepID=A0A1I5V6I3_9BACI|nr:dihydroxyacetone kinase phosphoryl donor subunit DhaM [Salibacterium halotolerans]SFQ03119.1 dihydroxyacetone kinase, phosphotransfer subunit [Salibacterium halotolerans]